jgi:hypothetical protein
MGTRLKLNVELKTGVVYYEGIEAKETVDALLKNP